MNAVQLATLYALAEKSTSDKNTQTLINEMLDVIGKLIKEVERQQDEIDSLRKVVASTAELTQSTNEGLVIIMEALRG